MCKQGFTLFEVCVALFLSSLLAGMTVPGMLGLLRKSELVRVNNELVGMLHAARLIAASQPQPVLLCSPASTGECRIPWREHLVLFVDMDGDEHFGGRDTVLHYTGRLPDAIFVRWQSFRQKPYVIWNEHGQSNASNGTMTVCHKLALPGLVRQLVINRAGRVRQIPMGVQPALERDLCV